MCKLWESINGSHPSRQENRVRKSERIRQLELELIRQQYEIEYLRITLQALMDSNNLKMPDLDSGKWYNRTNKD